MSQQPSELFISRAGSDSAFAEEIGGILEDAGHSVILQQWDFPNRSFIERMHAALSSGARVIALLSPEYLRSEYCESEWQSVLALDPLNRNSRLIVLRIAECEPPGLLAALTYWDLVPIRDDRPLLTEVVRHAVRADYHRISRPTAETYLRMATAIVDPKALRRVPSFTGRETELAAITDGLSKSGLVIVHGLAGTGKTALALEYIRRNRDRYFAVAWLSASTQTGIIDGLIGLGKHFTRGLDTVQDRTAAAEEALSTLARHSSVNRPVLLIFDNVEDPRELEKWTVDRIQALATTRIVGWRSATPTVRLHPWPPDEAIAYVKAESGRADFLDDETAAIADTLGRLPLALAHASAYLRETTTIAAVDYLDNIDTHMASAPDSAENPKAVFATIQESIERAERSLSGSAACLCLAAFFAPDSIPEELFQQPPYLYPKALNPERARESLGVLHRFSLVDFAVGSRTFTVHRLVQAAVRHLVGSPLDWLMAAVAVVDSLFPEIAFENWAKCERLISHAQAALDALPPDLLTFPRAGRLASRCGRYFYDRAAFGQAEPLFRRALAIAEASFGPNRVEVATALSDLGAVLAETDRLTEAETLARRALAIAEESSVAGDPQIAEKLNNLAVLLYETDRFFEAEVLFRRALKINAAHYGNNHPRVAVDFNNLAALLEVTNRPAEAEPLRRRALAIHETAYGPDDPRVATDLCHVAQSLQATNRLAEAEPLYRRALAIHEAAYGPSDPAVAADLNNLATLMWEMNRMAEVESPLRRALGIDEATHREEHPLVAHSLSNLAGFLRATNRFIEAEPLLRRALALSEKSCGTGHSQVAEVLQNLACLCKETNRLDEADRLIRRALAIEETIFGAVHPRVASSMSVLAGLLLEMNQLSEAEKLTRRAMEIYEASYGPDHPSLASRLSDLASILLETQQFDKAEPLLRRAVAIGEAAHGPDHPQVAIFLNNLACLFRNTDRWGEAETLLRRALRIDESAYGVVHPKVAIRLSNLALLLCVTGRLAEAEPLTLRALAIDEQSFGSGHPIVAVRLNNLAGLYRQLKRLTEAEQLFRRALVIVEASYGSDHPKVTAIRYNLQELMREKM